MKTNLTEITKAYLGSAAFFTIFTEGVIAVLPADSWLKLDPITAGILGFSVPALPFGWHLFDRVMYLTRPPQRTQTGPAQAYARSIAYNSNGKQGNLFANSVAWVVGSKALPGHTWGLNGEPGKTIGYKEPKPQPEFIFWERGMDSLITEVRLHNFCTVAWRRQQRVEYGDLPANQIFSRNWFTQDSRPRFPAADYRSIMYILTSRGLIINRWQGRAGKLKYPPGITVEEAKRRWSD